MRAYRWSVNLKLGLIVFAVLIAVASLYYTSYLVDRLREREQAVIELWAAAQAHVAQAQMQRTNPYRGELNALEEYLNAQNEVSAELQTYASLDSLRRAVDWAQNMPPADELNFITNNILIPNPFGIPAIISDADSQPLFWRNVSVPDTLEGLSEQDSARAMARLQALREEMAETYAPIPITLDVPGSELNQFVYYDESSLVKELRVFPYVQLLFVALFILVGYLGFSYVRRSEQSSLWVGMAREAAHQLGTPISSLMGWTQLLRADDLSEGRKAQALDEIENDVERLRRVANRFSDIGSQPKLEQQPLAPLIEGTVQYIRRRIPQEGRRVTLDVDVADDLRAPVNAELFEWVVENLLKNALDAIEEREGAISIRAHTKDSRVVVEVEDTGCGIERRQWKNIFRPGYSTKKRGWGLGLSLAQRIVEDYHGGTLAVAQSKPGKGTTFRIELPDGGRA